MECVVTPYNMERVKTIANNATILLAANNNGVHHGTIAELSPVEAVKMAGTVFELAELLVETGKID